MKTNLMNQNWWWHRSNSNGWEWKCHAKI